jgi:hypothetical protein
VARRLVEDGPNQHILKIIGLGIGRGHQKARQRWGKESMVKLDFAERLVHGKCKLRWYLDNTDQMVLTSYRQNDEPYRQVNCMAQNLECHTISCRSSALPESEIHV